MSTTLFQRDMLSIADLSLSQIRAILDLAAQFKKKSIQVSLADKLIAHCFFEPSTRTRLSFESAALRLEAKVIGFANAESLSMTKGETFSDTIKTIDTYADLLIVRHPREGAARLAAEVAQHPVINAGDGANQHPTQALADLLTIEETQSRLTELAIAIVGDLKYGRTVHSLIQACARFNCRFYFIAPPLLTLPEDLSDELKHQGIRFSYHRDLAEVIPKIDILYMTRLQQERFHNNEQELLEKQFILQAKQLEAAPPHLKILHPLPRAGELDKAIDSTPYAAYFQQVENALYVRQALLTLLLKPEIGATLLS